MGTEEQLKKICEDLLNTAKGLLRSYGIVSPALFVLKGSQTTQVDITIRNKNDLKVLADLMRHLADKETDGIFLMTLSRYKAFHKNTELPDTLDNCNATEAILGVLYTFDKTFIRNIPYMKDDKITIVDMGWIEKNSVEGTLSNPFISK